MINPAMIRISGRHIAKATTERCRIIRRSPPREERDGGETAIAGFHGCCAAVSTIVSYPARVESVYSSTDGLVCSVFQSNTRAGHTGTRIFTMTPTCEASDTQGALEFPLGPFDDVLKLLAALRELRHHHGVDGLVVDLGTDLRPRGSASHRGLFIAAWRIAVDSAERRLDGFPGIEVVHALERGKIVADRRRHELTHRFPLRKMQQKILGGLLVLREAPHAVVLR